MGLHMVAPPSHHLKPPPGKDTPRADALLWHLARRFRRLDYVYLNAGIMPSPHLNVKALFSSLFSR